ncbi:MAG: 3-deoxy-D-manno-octulosonic acid transferase [Synergistetes bacterium]|nr:3-deoxy-D-manno-octulosonic acid transferase [Synergistota bacterium]
MGEVSLPPSSGKRVWIHAVSVGEVKAALPLLRRLSDACLSVTTPTGYKIASQSGIENLFFYPWDLPWVVPRAIEAINPSLYILMETELWPLMITRLKKRGVKLILANGRISDRSYGGYKKLSYIMGGVLSCFDFIGAISEKDRERFVRLGAPAERVFVMGNLKYDSVLEAVDPSIERKMRRLLNLRDEPLWVCGSTHEGEERIAVKVYLKLLKDFPDLRLALVPRHPERARSIADTLLSLGVRFSLRSENPQDKVVLWDLMGELFGLYSVATVVFCGGSLVPLGGHNVIEPASWGKPVIYGPYMDDFLEETRFLEEAGAGFSVADENELYEVVRRLLLDGKARERIQLSLKEYLSRSKGVLERYLSVIDDLLGGGVSN